MSTRKPHNDLAGYVSERRNRYTGGHTILLDCKLAEEQGLPLVEDYRAEGGRYQVVCNDHCTILHTTLRDVAYGAMREPTGFCEFCRTLSAGKTPCRICGTPVDGERCQSCWTKAE